MGLFDHLESRGARLLPLVEGRISLARPGEEIVMADVAGGRARFEVDAHGICPVGLRWSDADEVRGGQTGRGRGQRDGGRVNARDYVALEPADHA